MNTVISVKVDKDIKESAHEVAKSAGLTLSSIINAYLRQLVATRRIEIYAPEPMTEKLEKSISFVEKEISSNKLSPKFDTTEKFLKELKK